MRTPALVIAPIRFPLYSVNQSLRSGPKVMRSGSESGRRTEWSTNFPPPVSEVMFAPYCSVNHIAPPGPATIPNGPGPGVPSSRLVCGRANCFTTTPAGGAAA